MATVVWSPNAALTAQVIRLTVTAVAANGTLTGTINGKAVTYTVTASDTATTAATGWFDLLDSSDAPPEFQEIDWTNPSDGVIVGAAATPGTPFTFTKSQAGGATANFAITTANTSPSDVNDNANWLRGGAPGIPQDGDNVIVANSDIPMLWNLDKLAAVQFATYQRWQSMTGQIGLPEYNANGYVEYRPTYFQFSGSAAQLNLQLGLGDGSGPAGERYNVGSQRTNVILEGTGSIANGFTYNLRFLGTNANNTITVTNGTVGVGMLPGEACTIASGTVDGGGSLDVGVGVTLSGNLTVTGSTAKLFATPGSLTVRNSSNVTLFAPASGLTFPTVSLSENCVAVLFGPVTLATITALEKSSQIDNSQNLSLVTIGSITSMDGDCQIIDPNTTITYQYPVTISGQVTAGPFQFTGPKTVYIA